jgi:hypothetical protein
MVVIYFQSKHMDTLSTRRSRAQNSFRRILFSPRYFNDVDAWDVPTNSRMRDPEASRRQIVLDALLSESSEKEVEKEATQKQFDSVKEQIVTSAMTNAV